MNSFSLRLLFCVFICGMCQISFAQKEYKKAMYDNNVNFYKVCEMAESYFSTIDRFQKGSGWNEFMRWRSENEGKYFPDGDRSKVDYSLPQRTFVQLNQTAKARAANPDWIDLGPYSADNITQGYNSGIGRIECFQINRSNADFMYMGSRSGGFWKTTDGGDTWKNTTDFLVATGVNTMSANPSNFNEVLINVRNANNGYTHGVYRSIDGGETWVATELNSSKGFGGLGTTTQVNIIKYHPRIKDLVFIGTNKGLYRSDNNLRTFTVLMANGNFTEIEFHPTDTKTIYFIQTNTATKSTITLSNDTGLSFTQSEPLPGFNGGNSIDGFLDVTPAKPNNVYFASGNGNVYYKSNNKGLNFIKTATSNGVGNFAISDKDSLHMVSGYLNLEGSSDGGNTFTQINNWFTLVPDETYTHADLRAADCIDGVFYIGTDGYFCKSSDNGATWKRLNRGTSVREFYRIGTSQSDKSISIGGSQDNGTSIINEDGWLEWNGGDGMEAIVHPLNKNMLMGSWQYGSRQRTLNGGSTRDEVENPQSGSSQADWISPMIFDPSDHMTVYHFSDTMFQSNLFGEPGSWTIGGSPRIGVITHAAIAENNSNIIVISRNASLLLSTNKGGTWKSIFPGLPSQSISDVVFDPKHDSTIVVCFDRWEANNLKIYITHNLGATWQNITYNLSNMPIRALAIDHTNERNIYAGAEIGVFVKSMNGTNWEMYNTKLPNTTVRDFEIHFASNTIKAATWGRGLWEAPLKGRESYPQIVQTIPSIEVSPGNPVPINSPMEISAKINYDKTISDVYLLWSHETKALNNRIDLKFNQNIWKTVNAITPALEDQFVYFKVIAVGENQDSTESYTYMYQQGPCRTKITNQTVRACKVYINGKDTLYKSTTLIKNFKDIWGCDSTLRFAVMVDAEPNNTISLDGNLLVSNEASAGSYQWLDCDNQFAIIPGQTTRYLTLVKSGNYALDITKNSCKIRTACYPLVIVDQSDYNDSDQKVEIIPNPNSGNFDLSIKGDVKNAEISILASDGKIVYFSKVDQNRSKINLSITPGMYMAKIKNNGNTIFKKLTIQ